MSPSLAIISLFLSLVAAQTPGKLPEVHPKLDTYKCTVKEGCKSQRTAVVLDSGSHPIYQAKATNLGCGDWGNGPNKTVCPDEATCAKNCIIDGIGNYADYGVTTKKDAVLLNMYGKNGVASPRIYLLAEGEKKYEMIKLTGAELSFDVDVSKLPCGMNGALYFSEMEAAGGQSKLNPGGAAYGTGYCDAQCFVTPWVNGVGNVNASGICCNELDIWEANKRSTSVAPHTCSKPGLYKCTGTECGATGVCDKNGCTNNPYAAGDKSYYGPGLKVDTNKPFTVVTQFPAKAGVLQEVKRLYIQNGKVMANANINVTGPMNDEYCTKNGASKFMSEGAMKGMGESMSRGMVLAMSIWWDEGGFMNWLDTGNAGPCNATEGDPKVVVKVEPAPAVTFSAIKWGEIGSTYSNKIKNQHPW
ncbi:cellulase [Clohesyomyces aquaticus]|uniref:Glucanase n=1 Tax=Clohesyomyces aquaticus TaxID=1231657 RepID=A0A1Y1ZLI5_9PLEO|nr:cellulase [Clohesyomyces aquaticus]